MTNTDVTNTDEKKLRAAVRAELDREEPTPLARLAAAYEANDRREHERQNERKER